jgi:hypothetical protein
MGRWKDRQTGTEIARHVYIHTYIHANIQRETDRQTGRQADRQTGRQADRQTGRQGDRQTGRQTDRQTDRQTMNKASRESKQLGEAARPAGNKVGKRGAKKRPGRLAIKESKGRVLPRRVKAWTKLTGLKFGRISNSRSGRLLATLLLYGTAYGPA